MSWLVATCAMAVVFSGCPDHATPATTNDATPDSATDAAAEAAASPDAEIADGGPPRPDLAWAVTERGPYQAGHRTLSDESVAPVLDGTLAIAPEVTLQTK